MVNIIDISVFADKNVQPIFSAHVLRTSEFELNSKHVRLLIISHPLQYETASWVPSSNNGTTISTTTTTLMDSKPKAIQGKPQPMDAKLDSSKSNNVRINELINSHKIPNSLFPESPTEKQV